MKVDLFKKYKSIFKHIYIYFNNLFNTITEVMHKAVLYP